MRFGDLLGKPEFYYWFLIPTVISFFVIIKSLLILLKKINSINCTYSLLIIIFVGFSEYVLFIIFFKDSWPTIIPFIGIGLALIIYRIQVNRLDR